ncbi:hypothetical protein Sjap_008825 [Stephania japonica]|uniref:Uncharacterized protein n=1 Tax=Stephania japonica TaxID=461633 RepID=A0AAP0JQB3_9MAGN
MATATSEGDSVTLSSLLDGSELKLGFPNLMLGNVWFASKTGGTRLKETLKGEVLLSQFLSHPALGDLLNDEDQKIFKFLSSLEVEDFKDVKSGYSITFDLANGVNHDKKGSKRPFSDESFLSWFSETQQKDLAEGFHDEDLVRLKLFQNSYTLTLLVLSLPQTCSYWGLSAILVWEVVSANLYSEISRFGRRIAWFSETQQKDLAEGFHDEVASYAAISF